jgi:hypothetical protein
MLQKKIRLQTSALRGVVKGALILIASLTLHSCSFMQAPGSHAAITPFSSDTRTSIQYVSWLHSLTAEEKHLERLRLETAYTQDSGSTLIEGVQLALLLNTLQPANSDDLLLALSLLTEINSIESVADDPLNYDYAEFAQLWHSALLQHASVLQISQEREGLIEQLQERNLQLHNDKLLLQEQNQLLVKQKTLLQEDIHNLQLQIDALKEIEQQLNQREQLQDSP